MLASVSFVLGILLAAIVLVFTRRQGGDAGPSPAPSALGWWTLGLGLAALAAFALSVLGPRTEDIRWLAILLPNLSIALGPAAVVAGAGALMRRERHWPVWVGLIAGLVPALFWILFAAGYLFGFGD